MTKVGYSSDVRSRMASLQRLVPVDLRLTYSVVGGRRLESALHRALTADGRHVFREWFTSVSVEEAKRFVSDARTIEADSTALGHRRLVALGDDYVSTALEAEIGSEARNSNLDLALKVAKRLERSTGPKSAAESLHAGILAVKFGFSPPPRQDAGYSLPVELPPRLDAETPAPEPSAAFASLLDL